MPREPEQPEQEPSGRAGLGPDPELAGGSEPAERVGPVVIRRLSKDDGRALIVYRAEPPAR